MRQHIEIVGSGSVSPTTPKAFANYSPGLLQPWVYVVHPLFNSEGVPPRQTPSVLSCFGLSMSQGWSLRQPWGNDQSLIERWKCSFRRGA